MNWVWSGEQENQLTRHWPSEQFRTVRDAMKLPQDRVIHSCRHYAEFRMPNVFCAIGAQVGESAGRHFVILHYSA
jgi:hypothetical protein